MQVATGAPLLTSIVSNDGIYADFDVDEQTYVQSIHAHADTQAEQQKIPVELTLSGDSGHVYKGFIQSFDNRISTGSGTIRARARFENADGALVPGMFAAVRLANADDSSVLLVPERAIGTDQSKKFLFVVDKEDKAAFREVTLGSERRWPARGAVGTCGRRTRDRGRHPACHAGRPGSGAGSIGEGGGEISRHRSA